MNALYVCVPFWCHYRATSVEFSGEEGSESAQGKWNLNALQQSLQKQRDSLKWYLPLVRVEPEIQIKTKYEEITKINKIYMN